MTKLKVLIIISIPVVLLIAWFGIIFSFLADGKNSSADIQGGSQNEENGKRNESTSNEEDSGNNGDDSENSGNNTGNNTKPTTKVFIHIPAYFYNEGFARLRKKLYSEEKIILKFVKHKDLNEYRRLLENKFGESDQINIFLGPTKRAERFSEDGYKIDFEEKNISQIFHYIFYYYLKADNYTFIPFSIDPMVTFVSEEKSFEGDMKISNLKEKLLTKKGTNKGKERFNIPIVFGIDNVAAMFLKNQKQIYPGYFNILYNIVYQSWLSQNYSLLEFFISSSSDEVYDYWDTRKFLKLKRLLVKKNSNCRIYPAVCIMAYGMTDFKFGYLSDFNKMENYLSEFPQKPENFQIFEFINSANIYPVRGRGFMVNKNSKNLKASLKFISYYLEEASSGNQYFRNNTLSPFNKVLSNQRVNKKYEKIFKYEDNFQFNDLNKEKKQNFLSDTKIIPVLKGDYSIKAFLDRLDWEF